MTEDEFKRPSPEALLKLAQTEEARQVRGRLTIYFGAAPGVGKTYTMLADARLRRQDGRDIVVGYVDTHGRAETEALLEGLEIIPPRLVEYLGIRLKEPDLEEIIRRKPEIVLVDELAHTNAPGSRHTKRHQDVEELLNAGIDVDTTLNVQHLESLNDIIYQIIGIRVRETVPDTVITAADEIKLIDLPPDELLKRLSEGKVYTKGIGTAVENFFRPGNLLALREIALRLVADSVDKRMLQYMEAHAIAGLWPVHERVLVGVFASPNAEKLVRSAFRLATELHAEWIAFHVETEKNRRFSDQEKQWLNKGLDLAKTLGARVVWIKGTDEAEEMAIYARNHNVTKIIIGKPRRFPLFPSISQRLLTRTANIDIYLLDAKADLPLPARKRLPWGPLAPPVNYLLSLLAVAVVTGIAFGLWHRLSQINLFMLFLLPVIGAAFYLGRGPSIFTALVSICLFDYLFVVPYYSFAIADLEYFLSFVVYVIIAVLISNLASGLRQKIELLRASESRSTAWDGLSRDLVTAVHEQQVLNMLVRHARQIFPGEMAVFLPEEGKLKVKAKTPGFEINPKVLGVAAWAFHNKLPAGRGTSTLPEAQALYVPMMTSGRAMGVLGFRFAAGDQVMTPENQVVLDTIARLGAMALERIWSR
jgi:two-component system sensor histidine kinase KdpD